MHLELALKMIRMLSVINEKTRTKRLAYDTFYLPELMEYVDLQSDYVMWITGKVFLEARRPVRKISGLKFYITPVHRDIVPKLHRTVHQAQLGFMFQHQHPEFCGKLCVFDTAKS